MLRIYNIYESCASFFSVLGLDKLRVL